MDFDGKKHKKPKLKISLQVNFLTYGLWTIIQKMLKYRKQQLFRKTEITRTEYGIRKDGICLNRIQYRKSGI